MDVPTPLSIFVVADLRRRVIDCTSIFEFLKDVKSIFDKFSHDFVTNNLLIYFLKRKIFCVISKNKTTFYFISYIHKMVKIP